MALTDDERRMLEQLEAQLANDDPALARVLAKDDSNAPEAFGVSPKHLVLGLVVAVLGLIVVLCGVAMSIIPIGIAGAIIVFAGFWCIASGSGKGKPKATRVNSAAGSPAGKRAEAARSDFMQRQAEAWERRRDERGF